MITILYIRGCIIEANKEDSDQDILTKEDIKKININLTSDIYFDIQHNCEPITGCRLIENTVIDYPVSIAGQMINPGSWVGTVEVNNSELEQLILNGTIKGFSLFSYAGGNTTYKEVLDKSDVYPLFISFVEYPANHILFEVLDRDSYISKMEGENLADEKSLIDKIKELLTKYEESTDEEETIVDKEVEESVAEATEEETAVEKAEELEDEVVEPQPIEEQPQAEDVVETDTEVQPQQLSEDKTIEEEPVVVKEEENVCQKADEEPSVEIETQEEEPVVEKDETGVTNADLLSVLVEIRDALVSDDIEESVEEEMVTVEEVLTEDEEPLETYIIKQASAKVEAVTETKKEPKQYFDMFGKKIQQ